MKAMEARQGATGSRPADNRTWRVHNGEVVRPAHKMLADGVQYEDPIICRKAPLTPYP